MKKSIIILFIFLNTIKGFLFAQTKIPGIYLNSGDFLNGKVTHGGKHTRILLHELLRKDHLDVVCAEGKFVYRKKDVYGYVNAEGFCYRFYNDHIFPIMNPNERILLYQKISGTGMKNSPVVESYFFSRDAASEILPLTIENLDQAFHEFKAFTRMIDLHFKDSDDLAEYDEAHAMYKLNDLLQLSREEMNY